MRAPGSQLNGSRNAPAPPILPVPPAPESDLFGQGGTIDISNWIATRDRRTWITLAEVLVLGLVLFTAGTTMHLVLGIPLLAHLGWSALTSLPVGEVPGPPPGVGERRRNHELRSRVVRFLNEVKRVENYVRNARMAKLPRDEVEKTVRSSEKRIMATAGEVVEAIGRSTQKTAPR